MEGRMRLPLLFGFGQLCLSFKQVAEFFDHQYICMESIDTIFFLLGDNHQRKKGSETTSFSWVLPVVPLVQSDSRILWSSISQEGINQNPRFFVWR